MVLHKSICLNYVSNQLHTFVIHKFKLIICMLFLAIVCSTQSAPENGKTTCNESSNFGDTCSFSCGDGFSLIGFSTSTCLDDDGNVDGDWSNPVPTCEGI